MVDDFQLMRKEKLELRLKRLKEGNGLAAYRPHEKQQLFHGAANFAFRYLRTGNRFGKSTCGCAEDCAFAVGERPWFRKDDPRRYVGIPKRSTKGLIVVHDWDKAEEVLTGEDQGQGKGKLMQLLPKGSYTVQRNNSGHIHKIMVKSIHGGVSTIYIDTVKSFLNSAMSQESSDWDWVHIDEPCPKDMWTAISRGLVDREGKAWFTCTPIVEMWINDFFIPGKIIRNDFEKPLEREEESKWVMTGSIYDNPTISEVGIKRFAADLTASDREARLYGRPKMMAGAIYKEFDVSTHVYDTVPFGWHEMNMPPDDYTIRLAIDPHFKTPHAVLFAATSPHGFTFFYDEIFEPVLIDHLVDRIYERIRYMPNRILLDPLAYTENPVDGTKMADVFERRGLQVEKAPKDLQNGILLTQQALSRRDPRTGRPTLLFSSQLQRTLWEFDRYVWDPKREKPIDANDHMMENLYRLVYSGLTYVNNADYQKINLEVGSFNTTDLSLPELSMSLPGLDSGFGEPNSRRKAVRYRV